MKTTEATKTGARLSDTVEIASRRVQKSVGDEKIASETPQMIPTSGFIANSIRDRSLKHEDARVKDRRSDHPHLQYKRKSELNVAKSNIHGRQQRPKGNRVHYREY